MMHTNAPQNKRRKAQLRAVGEIIRKNGERQEVVLEGYTDLSKEELEKKLETKIDEVK